MHEQCRVAESMLVTNTEYYSIRLQVYTYQLQISCIPPQSMGWFLQLTEGASQCMPPTVRVHTCRQNSYT